MGEGGEIEGGKTMNEIEKVTRWRTRDGEEFGSFGSAERHAEVLHLVDKANEVLEEGGSVADAFRILERYGEIDPILEQVTKDTELVISHWQCRDTPGYQVQRINSDLSIRVFGDAGSWNGPYGDDVLIEDLARYAKYKGTIFNKKKWIK